MSAVDAIEPDAVDGDFRPVQGHCPRSCARSVCAEWNDLDSMRKMSVQFTRGKDGKPGK